MRQKESKMNGKWIFGLVISIGLLGCSKKADEPSLRSDILAIVNQDTVRASDLMALLERQNRKKVDVQNEQVRQDLLNHLVQHKLIHYYGLDNRLNEEEEVKLEKNTRRDEMYYEKILRTQLYDPMISDAELVTFYDKLKTEVRAQQIVIGFKDPNKVFVYEKIDVKRAKGDAKRLADSLYEALKREPQKFDNFVEEFSDDKDSKYLKGDLGFIRYGRRPEIEAVVFSAAPGAISAPLETDNGYCLVRVNEKRNVSNLRPFEEAKTGLKDMMIGYLMRDRKAELETVRRRFIDSLLTARDYKTDRKNGDRFLAIYQNTKKPSDLAAAFNASESGLALASYKGGMITVSELVHVMKNNSKMIKMDYRLLEEGLRNAAARRAMADLAREKGIELSAAELEILNKIESESMISLAIRRLYEGQTFDDKDVASYFETNKEEYRRNGMVNIAEIASPDMKALGALWQEVKGKNNFDSVYARASNTGGFTCRVTGMIPDDNSDMLRQKSRNLAAGAISDVFAKVNQEAAFIKVIERKQGAIPSYHEVRERVMEDYISFRKQIAYNEWIANLSAKYKVQLFPERLKEIFDIKLR